MSLFAGSRTDRASSIDRAFCVCPLSINTFASSMTCPGSATTAVAAPRDRKATRTPKRRPVIDMTFRC